MYLQNALVVFASLQYASAFRSNAHDRVPLQVPISQDSNTQNAPDSLKVAIIGAGAGGSSAAFFLNKAKERFGHNIRIDVFDKEDYIGGRSTTVHPHGDESYPPQELGASIFVQANKNLIRASNEFKLKRIPLDEGHSDPGFTVWDGEGFPITVTGSWTDAVKVVWRYGYAAPTTVSNAVTSLVNTLHQWYSPSVRSWKDIDTLTTKLNYTNVIDRSGAAWYDGLGVNPKFTRELIDASTRCNYASDITDIHGLGGAVSMATDGAEQIHGGNWQIFASFLKASKANINLRTTVTGLSKTTTSGSTKWTVSTSNVSAIVADSYDHVILATPFHLSDITILGSDTTSKILPSPYVHLHVTLVSSSSRHVQKSFFNTWFQVSDMILTTSSGNTRPDFQSISYHNSYKTHSGEEEHVFKLFSLDKKSDEWLERVWGKGTLKWVYRKEWDSYPKLIPGSSFSQIRVDDGLWYVNSLEPWISTMETETVSGRNTVDLLLEETYGSGLCYKKGESRVWSEEETEKLVYGFDC